MRTMAQARYVVFVGLVLFLATPAFGQVCGPGSVPQCQGLPVGAQCDVPGSCMAGPLGDCVCSDIGSPVPTLGREGLLLLVAFIGVMGAITVRALRPSIRRLRVQRQL